MKKRILTAIAALVCAAIFVSCGANGISGTIDTPTPAGNNLHEATTKCRMLGEIPDEYKAGDTPVDFEAELLDGQTVRLSDLQGKVVLVNFWSLTCKLCLVEMPAFEMLLDEYGDDLVILAVNTGDRKEDVAEFIREKGYAFDVGVDESQSIQYPCDGLPYTLVIDQKGVIASVHVGGMADVQLDFDRYDTDIKKLIG